MANPVFKYFAKGAWHPTTRSITGSGAAVVTNDGPDYNIDTPSIPQLASYAGYAAFPIYTTASGSTISRNDFQSLWYALPQSAIGLGGHYPSTSLDGIIYHFACTWKVSANYSFQLQVGNGSIVNREFYFNNGIVQDSTGATETLSASSTGSLLPGFGAFFNFSGGGTLLDYTNPARPKFIAGDIYNMLLVFYLHF